MAIPVVLDVDTGTDDAAALLWAATDPAIELVAAMATWGNTTVEQAARNTRAVLHAAGRTDVPVFVGEGAPLGPCPQRADARHIMGTDGLGDVGLADRVLGPADLDRLTRARPGGRERAPLTRAGPGDPAAPPPLTRAGPGDGGLEPGGEDGAAAPPPLTRAGPGDGGLEPGGEDGAAALTRLTRARPGELTLLAVAPLSTVALALRRDPGLAGRLAGVVVMGGAIGVAGNITAAAEANIGHDPVAAAEVIDVLGAPGALAGGATPRLVPLDVTLASALTGRELAAVGGSSVPGAADLHGVWTAIWPNGRLETGEDGCWPAHDLLAAWTVCHPEVCGWERLPLRVDTGGSAGWGATIADRRLLRLTRWAERWGSAAALEAMAETRGIPANRWDIAGTVDADAFRAGVRAWLGAP